MDEVDIEQVETFKYLGTALKNKGNLEDEIISSIKASNKNYLLFFEHFNSQK